VAGCLLSGRQRPPDLADASAGCRDRRAVQSRQSAAVTAIPAPSFWIASTGHIARLCRTSGKILWDYDTNREFQNTVNGVPDTVAPLTWEAGL